MCLSMSRPAPQFEQFGSGGLLPINAIQICCLYNFINRFTFGAGLAAIEAEFAVEAGMLHKGYTPLIEKLGL